MEIDANNEGKVLPEYSTKSGPATVIRESTHQQKTTAESGDGEELWLPSFLNKKGLFTDLSQIRRKRDFLPSG